MLTNFRVFAVNNSCFGGGWFSCWLVRVAVVGLVVGVVMAMIMMVVVTVVTVVKGVLWLALGLLALCSCRARSHSEGLHSCSGELVFVDGTGVRGRSVACRVFC